MCDYSWIWLISGSGIHSNGYFYYWYSFWPSNSRWPPYWFLMPMWPFKWHAPMPYWNIFDRLFLLSDVMIWPNFALGIQDGRHPPFWIAWIFTLSSYMRVIHQTRLISCYKVISYITLIITNYDKFVIWPFNSRWPPYAMLNFIIYLSGKDTRL